VYVSLFDTDAIRVDTKAPALRTAVLDNTAKNDMVMELANFILLFLD
jgi:hypothetical protein